MTFEPSDNFVIEVDLAAIDYPETASVIHAKRIVFDYEAGKEILGFYTAEFVLQEERFDADGKTILANSAELSHIFRVGYDIWEEGMPHESRKPTDWMSYEANLKDSSQNILVNIADSINWISDQRREILPYVSNTELPDLLFADAQAELMDMICGLGIGEADMPLLDQDYTYTLPAEKQSFLNEIAGFTADYSNYSDGYTFRFRQEFGGIPLNWMEWNTRIAGQSVSANVQQIFGSVSVNGERSLLMKNLVSPHTYHEVRPIVSPVIIIEQVNEILSASLTDDIYYLSDIELCYAIFETDVRDELVLYPYWLVPLEVETDISGTGRTRVNWDRDIYAFNAFTGELVNSVSLPVE